MRPLPLTIRPAARIVEATETDVNALLASVGPHLPREAVSTWAGHYWPVLHRAALTCGAPMKPCERVRAVAVFAGDVALAVQGGLPALSDRDAHALTHATAGHLWETVTRPHLRGSKAALALLTAAVDVACPL